MRNILKRIIKYCRPFYWPFVKAYFLYFSPETQGVRIILTHKGEILLIKNSYGLKYNFPGGGIGKNEDPEAGIRREVKEELGISLKEVVYLDSIVPDIEYEYRKNTISIFTSELESKDITINNLEVEDAQWFDLDRRFSLGHVAYQIFELYKKRYDILKGVKA